MARSGLELDLGDGALLDVILTPTPRWPDLMVLYYEPAKILMTSKFYSAHAAGTIKGVEVGRA